MQKVLGENLHGFDTLPKEGRNGIRIAFIEALWYVFAITSGTEDVEVDTFPN